MPPPDNGNEHIPFTQLIALEKLGANTFRSIALAYGPAKGNRTYGGHVYMQACYAAAQTVPKDMVLHVSMAVCPINLLEICSKPSSLLRRVPCIYKFFPVPKASEIEVHTRPTPEPSYALCSPFYS